MAKAGMGALYATAMVWAAAPTGCGSERPSAASGPPPATSALAASKPASVERVAYGAAPQMYGELRMPQGAGPFPVALLVHGGCWLSEVGLDYLRPLAEALVARGYAVWSVEYRRVGDPGGGWPNTYADAAAGADHLRVLAKSHAIDLARVVAVGHSAGGAIALWLAARPSLPPGSALTTVSPLPIAGVLALAPAVDLEAIGRDRACDESVSKMWEDPPSERASRYDLTSPMRRPPSTPQVIVIGGRDTEWAPSGRAYAARAREKGAERVDVLEAATAEHMDVVKPGAEAWGRIARALDGLAGR